MRKLLTQALSDMSERLYSSFQRQVRLVVHGGAVIVLRPSFSHRESTQGRRLHPTAPSYPSIAPSVFPMQFNDFQTCFAETTRKFGFGADWMKDHADVALPWATRVRRDSRPLARFLSDVTLIISQPTRTQLRSDLRRLDAEPKCCSADDLLQARSRPHRCSLAIGHRAQTDAPRKAGHHRLGRGASPQRRATHHPLDARWTRAVLSVTRFHSRNQGSVLSCHAVLIAPSYFPYNQGR